MQAMVLAAGFGTRLLPYTKLRPKPLFPLLGEPLLLLTIKRLQNAGFDHIIVNCHHLKEQIVDALAGIKGVVVQEEDMVLGTGGGLQKALPLMRNEPLLISNGDIYHCIDYRELYLSHCTGAAVTMALHDFPRFNSVTVEGGRVTGFDDTCSGRLAFTGVHILDPEILKGIVPAQKNCIIDRYRALLQEGKTISAQRVDGCSWTDMGTVDDYLTLHGRLLKGEVPLWPEFTHKGKGPFLMAGQADHTLATFYDWVCVGKARLGDNVSLTRCVVWDGAEVAAGSIVSDSLLV